MLFGFQGNNARGATKSSPQQMNLADFFNDVKGSMDDGPFVTMGKDFDTTQNEMLLYIGSA